MLYNEAERSDDDDEDMMTKARKVRTLDLKDIYNICKVERVIYMHMVCVNAIINYYVVRVE